MLALKHDLTLNSCADSSEPCQLCFNDFTCTVLWGRNAPQTSPPKISLHQKVPKVVEQEAYFIDLLFFSCFQIPSPTWTYCRSGCAATHFQSHLVTAAMSCPPATSSLLAPDSSICQLALWHEAPALSWPHLNHSESTYCTGWTPSNCWEYHVAATFLQNSYSLIDCASLLCLFVVFAALYQSHLCIYKCTDPASIGDLHNVEL